MILSSIILVLISGYACLMLFYAWGFSQIPEFILKENYQPTTTVSVLIPARNEGTTILNLLNDILNQNFPKQLLQIIVIDDHSTDNTVEVITDFKDSHSNINLLLLKLSDTEVSTAFKKKAIEYAISNSTGDLIITTDADCRAREHWLMNLVSFYETKHVKIIAAPVKYIYNPNSFTEKFQALDFIGLIGITGASIHTRLNNMCNGANLCYEKKAFIEVNGYRGNDNLSSGDDLFLMHKIAARFPKAVSFIKSNDACVSTYAKPTWGEFLQQRMRWSSKSVHYAERSITFILMWVYAVNVMIPGVLLLLFFIHHLIYTVIAVAIIKAVADFIFLYTVSSYFKQKELMKIFIPAGLAHVVYIILAGALGQLKGFEWKGRQLKK